MVKDETQETHTDHRSDQTRSELEISLKNYLKGLLHHVRQSMAGWHPDRFDCDRRRRSDQVLHAPGTQ